MLRIINLKSRHVILIRSIHQNYLKVSSFYRPTNLPTASLHSKKWKQLFRSITSTETNPPPIIFLDARPIPTETRETLLIAAVSFFNRKDPIDPSPLKYLPSLPLSEDTLARVGAVHAFRAYVRELARAAIAGQRTKEPRRSSLWQFVNSANCRAVVNGRLPIIEPITNAELSGIHSLVNCNFLPTRHANTRPTPVNCW